MYSLKVPVRVLVVHFLGRQVGRWFRFYFHRGKLVKTGLHFVGF